MPDASPVAPADRTGPRVFEGTPLRTLDEDALLARVLPLYPTGPDLQVPPGDDAAVLTTSPRTVATTDTVVLGRDWLDEWSSGEDVGHKVIAQNLADVAAMGAVPTGVLLTLVADPEVGLEWVLDHARGVAHACRDAGVAVLGGDLSSASAGVVMVSVTALGRLDVDPVLRSGARPGDVVAVRGELGLAAAGLLLLQRGRADRHPEAVARQRRPQPPLGDGPVAARAGATAMLDLSDGLARDAGRVARASDVVVDVEAAALDPDVDRLRDAVGDRDALSCVLSGGEDHALFATFAPGSLPAGWRRLGSVRARQAGEPARLLVDGQPVTRPGWDHFTPGG